MDKRKYRLSAVFSFGQHDRPKARIEGRKEQRRLRRGREIFQQENTCDRFPRAGCEEIFASAKILCSRFPIEPQARLSLVQTLFTDILKTLEKVS